MTTEKKNKYREWMNTTILILTFLAVVFGGYKAAIAWGKYTENQKNIQEQLMFQSAEQRIKTKNHVNSPWTEYEVRMKSDTLIKMQKVVLQGFDTINKVLASDEEDKADRIKSRARRDSLFENQGTRMEQMEKNQQNINNALLSIQRTLDTIN